MRSILNILIPLLACITHINGNPIILPPGEPTPTSTHHHHHPFLPALNSTLTTSSSTKSPRTDPISTTIYTCDCKTFPNSASPVLCTIQAASTPMAYNATLTSSTIGAPSLLNISNWLQPTTSLQPNATASMTGSATMTSLPPAGTQSINGTNSTASTSSSTKLEVSHTLVSVIALFAGLAVHA